VRAYHRFLGETLNKARLRILGVPTSARAQHAQRRSGERAGGGALAWEYRSLDAEPGRSDATFYVENYPRAGSRSPEPAVLELLGNDGWELVGVVPASRRRRWLAARSGHRLYFKRPRGGSAPHPSGERVDSGVRKDGLLAPVDAAAADQADLLPAAAPRAGQRVWSPARGDPRLGSAPNGGVGKQSACAASPSRTVARQVIWAVFLGLLIFLALRSMVQSFRVDGPSMEPTLRDGQLLLINKAAYLHADGTLLQGRVPSRPQGSIEYLFGGPRRGDLVVFRAITERNRKYVKRIIGLPGDEVSIRRGTVWVNGRELDELCAQPPTGAESDGSGPANIPDGSYFVLGDNRPESSDSREGWFVPVENLVGRVWLSYWPPDTWGAVRHQAPCAPDAPSR
jgi:signal peptidase I